MFRRILPWAALLALPASLLLVRHIQRRTLVPQPRGLVLGLYAGVPDYDYAEELDRIAASGATAVSLQAIYRMERYDSVEIVPHPTSSPTDEALLRTFREARVRGLRMMFFPTINLRDEADNAKWWRGDIQPKDWDLWWRNYTAFNVRMAELAEAGGVEWYSVGTEMESTHRFPERWCALVADVRKVFHGKVTYSVNFDAHDSFSFGQCLDVIGMNTYDPIAKYDEYPTPAQIRDEWWWIVNKARTLSARFKRPVMITEVGYPSVAHAHVGPWDFRTDKPADPELQDLLMKGAFGVLRNWSDGEAAFYYLYGENLVKGRIPGGPGDRTYAPWNKPVELTLRDYFRQPIWEGHIPPKAEDIREAVVQTLLSQDRKMRGFEDYELPAWSVAWRAAHPEDEREAQRRLALEPPPARKVPKGEER
ncbi:MAG TPA: hypothetical protein VJ600_08105 [Holophagaceae bacterium]|nr:hypothetical protein [Holophagaceae bacterium]